MHFGLPAFTRSKLTCWGALAVWQEMRIQILCQSLGPTSPPQQSERGIDHCRWKDLLKRNIKVFSSSAATTAGGMQMWFSQMLHAAVAAHEDGNFCRDRDHALTRSIVCDSFGLLTFIIELLLGGWQCGWCASLTVNCYLNVIVLV